MRLRLTPLRVFAILFGLAVALFGWGIHSFFATPNMGFLNEAFVALGLLLALAAALPDRWLAGFYLVFFSVSVPILLVDLAAQALTPKWEAVLVDEHYITRLNPNAVTPYAVRRDDGPGVNEVRINSAGYRGAELEPSPGRRIVVYGDSFIYAAATDDENTFPVRLGRGLEAATGARAEVVNAGVLGHGPDQLLLRMREELPELRPDLVVVSVFGGNDYGDLLRNRLFELDERGRLQRAPTQLDDDLLRSARLPRFRSYILHQLGKLRPARFATTPQLDASGRPAANTRWVGRFLDARRQEYRRAVLERDYVVTRADLVNDYPDVDIAFEPHSESARYKRALMEQVLLEIAATVRNAGARVAVLLIPDPDHLIDNYDGRVIDRAAWPDFDPTAATGNLASFLASEGIPALDLYPVYAARNSADLFLDMGDNHWNDAGQAVAAEAFSEYLIGRGLYP